jgi:hypothetical protein
MADACTDDANASVDGTAKPSWQPVLYGRCRQHAAHKEWESLSSLLCAAIQSGSPFLIQDSGHRVPLYESGVGHGGGPVQAARGTHG